MEAFLVCYWKQYREVSSAITAQKGSVYQDRLDSSEGFSNKIFHLTDAMGKTNVEGNVWPDDIWPYRDLIRAIGLVAIESPMFVALQSLRKTRNPAS